MSGLPFAKFFWNDWAGDPLLKLCSFAAQGVWMRLLCIAAESKRAGFVLVAGRQPSTEELTRVIGGAPEEVAKLIDELERNGVFSRDRHRTIYCRRMIREAKKRAASAKGGKIGGRATHERQRGIFSTQEATQDATQGTTQHPYSRSHIPEARSQKPEKEDLLASLAPRDAKPRNGSRTQKVSKNRTAMPKDWPTEQQRQAAQKMWTEAGRSDLVDDVDNEAEKCRDHHAGKGTLSADWAATWRYWTRNAPGFNKQDQRRATGAMSAVAGVWAGFVEEDPNG